MSKFLYRKNYAAKCQQIYEVDDTSLFLNHEQLDLFFQTHAPIMEKPYSVIGELLIELDDLFCSSYASSDFQLPNSPFSLDYPIELDGLLRSAYLQHVVTTSKGHHTWHFEVAYRFSERELEKIVETFFTITYRRNRYTGSVTRLEKSQSVYSSMTIQTFTDTFLESEIRQQLFDVTKKGRLSRLFI
jgi:hypothetical protein